MNRIANYKAIEIKMELGEFEIDLFKQAAIGRFDMQLHAASLLS